jgi:hypothetical protein
MTWALWRLPQRFNALALLPNMSMKLSWVVA